MKTIQLKNSLEEIYKNINNSQQPNQQVKLLAVTKNHPPTAIQKATELGICYFGENKVQEAETKKPHLSTETELHLIGHLQSNKIKKALTIFNVIQTVDTLKLAIKINLHAAKMNKKQRIYCQINIGKDPNKTGFTIDELNTHIKEIVKLPNIFLEGVMTILPQGLKDSEIKNLYTQTKRIRDDINKTYNRNLELSMGMSNDYQLAIECGSTFVRIGTKLFGQRK